MEAALASGMQTINFYLVHKNEEKECQIKIMEDTLKISPIHSDLYYTFDYSILEPKFQVIEKDPTRLQIVFNQKYEKEAKKFINAVFSSPISSNSRITGMESSMHSARSGERVGGQVRYEMRFMGRKNRDIFLFILKAFFTKK